MPLLFTRGALTSHQESSVRHLIDKYPYAILLNAPLPYQWTQNNLIMHQYVGECSTVGIPYIKQSHLYASLTTTQGVLYFFQDVRDYESVCAFSELVIDTNPFQTIIL